MADIYEIAETQKKALISRERMASSELVRAYGLAHQRIQARIVEITDTLEAAKLQGEIISSSYLYERDRLSNLKIEIEREMRRFSVFATARVTSEQGSAVEIAATDAQRLVGATLGHAGASLGLKPTALNSEAIERLVGFSGDGSPLRTLFDKIAPQMAHRITQELVSGVAEGAGARVIAARIRERSGMGLARALVISRQEVLRAYRAATLDAYQASGVVLKWRWSATLTPRTCAVCWAMHGREFPLSNPMRPHIACRCTMIPVTSETQPSQTGAEAFSELEPGAQREILGAGKFEAFRDGKFQLEDLVGVRHDPQFGTTRYERSLKDLMRRPGE